MYLEDEITIATQPSITDVFSDPAYNVILSVDVFDAQGQVNKLDLFRLWRGLIG
jgi:hypothetical protein